MSDLEASAALVRRLGWLADFDIAPAGGTGNNRVFSLRSAGQRFLLKRYFQHPADPRDRFGAERAFYQFTREAGIDWVPRPMAWDTGDRVAMFEFIEGERPNTATPALVRQALDFFSDINANRELPSASALSIASEACFSIAEHLQTVERRIQRLGTIVPARDVDREAVELIAGKLTPAWIEIARTIRSRIPPDELIRPLASDQRCITPSDFGFHNAIIRPDGKLRFFDFEYAGWDDPSKTICDFFCQPAVPVPCTLFDGFSAEVRTRIIGALPHSPEMLLPVYRIKWCCIMLNEFLPAEQSRRAFSDPHADHHARKAAQLAKVRAALAVATQPGVTAPG